MPKLQKEQTWEDYYFETIHALADSANRLYFANIWQHLYVYIKPSGDGFSFIPYVAEDPTGDDKVGITECIPKSATVPQLINWLRERCGRLPIIPVRFN